jgi:hypothetical protein
VVRRTWTVVTVTQQSAVKLVLKYLCPLLLLIAVLTPVIGHYNKWAPAQPYLDQTGEASLQIGFRCGPSKCTAGQYLLLPSSISNLTSITISYEAGQAPQVRVNRYGFPVWLARFVAAAIATWWFWFRPRKQSTEE